MARFMCDCTPEVEIFKTEESLLHHLRFQHDINIVSCAVTWTSPSACYYCELCKVAIAIHDTSELMKHRKHKYYSLEKKSFRSLRSLLCHIGYEYDVHCGYSKGISNKKVYLDGMFKGELNH